MERCKVLINENAEKGYASAIIVGVLNLFTAKQARAELEPLLSRERVRVIVDLEDLEAIDSSGIGALVNFILAIRKHEDARVVFTQPRSAVMHVFEVTKLISFFTIVSGASEAEQYFAD
ncbi:MAG: STAS domain-containing protein [Spirochaetota bacterium]